MNKTILDTPLYTITKYIYYLFIIQVYFILCNILFFLVLLLAEFVFANILLFYLSLIPVGPALTAVCSTMGTLVREKDIRPTVTYFKAYKQNFVPSLKYWLIQLTIFLILAIDIYYSINHLNVLSPLFFMMMIGCLFLMMYAFPILSRFEVSTKNLFLIATYAIFKFPKITILNTTTIIAFSLIYSFLPSISSLFIVSLSGFFIMYNLKETLTYLETEKSVHY